ncbi:MAG TPA: hypothetical protein QGH10_19275 [Armatimonadota bacterium]|jgi:hypothetical protein|nr:hypothetical protein [Armatimonadota bacterium]
MVAFGVYRQQAVDFIRLQAWYVWHLHVQRGLPGERIFGARVVRFLYEHAGAAEEPAWQALQQHVLSECRRHGENPDTGALEDRLLADVRAFVDDRYLLAGPYARYQENVRQAAPYYGFTHDVDGARLALHFTNTVAPDSPLRHPEELQKGLARLVSLAWKQHPQLTTTYCGSWLNSVSRFTDLFPESWLGSAEDSPPAGHGGWWGQFTDRTGALHRGNARHLRETGEFRFPFRRCTCPQGELVAHLAAP